jgi:hypothetical protein
METHVTLAAGTIYGTPSPINPAPSRFWPRQRCVTAKKEVRYDGDTVKWLSIKETPFSRLQGILCPHGTDSKLSSPLLGAGIAYPVLECAGGKRIGGYPCALDARYDIFRPTLSSHLYCAFYRLTGAICITVCIALAVSGQFRCRRECVDATVCGFHVTLFP